MNTVQVKAAPRRSLAKHLPGSKMIIPGWWYTPPSEKYDFVWITFIPCFWQNEIQSCSKVFQSPTRSNPIQQHFNSIFPWFHHQFSGFPMGFPMGFPNEKPGALQPQLLHQLQDPRALFRGPFLGVSPWENLEKSRKNAGKMQGKGWIHVRKS